MNNKEYYILILLVLILNELFIFSIPTLRRKCCKMHKGSVFARMMELNYFSKKKKYDKENETKKKG